MIERIKIGNVNQATVADREKINEIIDYLNAQEYQKLTVSGFVYVIFRGMYKYGIKFY